MRKTSPFRGGTEKLIALLPLTLAALAIAAPLLATSPLLSLSIRKFFSIVCHQDPARSFWIAGAPIAVCVRCLGIYLGGALGSAGVPGSPRLQSGVAWASRPRLLASLAITAALNALDVAAEWTGLHDDLPAMRFALGIALGAAAGALVHSSLRDSVSPANAGCRSENTDAPSPAGLGY
ncbi:MAG: DUF2085 domain-containing protein [Candidatus Koribacter versatilis]|uniref:DUF2085 domain-containing protein n=1 Tax=Candidatus Korobacter versatilis TaxID=658062 RepID=A0A932EQ77_9BACT|nr:DUF2085 domain-containing protein [Candidatus Koribacter versatilis]